MRAGLGERLMFGSGLDVTEWAAGIGSMVKSIEDAPSCRRLIALRFSVLLGIAVGSEGSR
jgi:hypothetical protein